MSHHPRFMTHSFCCEVRHETDQLGMDLMCTYLFDRPLEGPLTYWKATESWPWEDLGFKLKTSAVSPFLITNVDCSPHPALTQIGELAQFAVKMPITAPVVPIQRQWWEWLSPPCPTGHHGLKMSRKILVFQQQVIPSLEVAKCHWILEKREPKETCLSLWLELHGAEHKEDGAPHGKRVLEIRKEI